MAGSGAESDPLLPQPWFGYWRQALKAMKDQESWSPQLRPLLDEYIGALRAAADAQVDDRATDWDRHVKRASALADQLALTPRGRKAAGVGESEDVPEDPFAKFGGPRAA